MNNKTCMTLKFSIWKAIAFMLIFLSCERDISNDAILATYSKTAAVFIDDFVGMGTNFIKFYGGSNFQSFSVDRTQGYESSASIRINVPNASNTNGNYAGGVFVIDGAGRDLTDFNALTFWIKASRGVSIEQLGFGEDFGENKYMASLVNVNVETGWSKVIIPFPDSSKLTNERGVFRYAAGTQGTSGVAYTFWIDEIKFEKIGTISNPQRSIQTGNNATINTYIGITSQLKGIQTVFNMPDISSLAVVTAPEYFTFSTSNPSVATINEKGAIKSLGAGSTIITAKFNGVLLPGSLTVNCFGAFPYAPTPTRPSSNVISIFSNYYTNRPVNYFNGYWQPWQTTLSEDFIVNGDNVLHYTIFNFVGIDFSSPTINATSMTHFHADFYFPNSIAAGRQLRVLVLDYGANGVNGGGDDTRHSTTFLAPILVTQNWVSIDIPFSAMPSLASRANLGQIIFEGGDGTPLYVDNIYFYNN
jgi:hypothetical protein